MTVTKSNKQELLELFTARQIANLDRKTVPTHVAIIPDGNRRWAKRFLFSPEKGHREGARILTDIVHAARILGVKTLTLYTFSTENWKRPKTEVNLLMKLLKDYLIEQRPDMIKKGVRLCTIGDLTAFSPEIIKVLDETKKVTAKGKNIDLVLALNYGGRDEIRRAIHSMIEDCASGQVKKEDLTVETIGGYMDTAEWGDPDLLIRTSGEQRISNFLLWQISYSEIYTTETLWPEFTPKHLLEAILDFQKRERRGGI